MSGKHVFNVQISSSIAYIFGHTNVSSGGTFQFTSNVPSVERMHVEACRR